MKVTYKTIYDVKHKVYHTFENGDFFSDVNYFEKNNKDKINPYLSRKTKIKSGSFIYNSTYYFTNKFSDDFYTYYQKCSAIIHRDDIALIQTHLEKHNDTQLNAIVNFLTENTNIQSVYYNFYYQTVENYAYGDDDEWDIDCSLSIEADYASSFFDINDYSFKKLFSQQTLSDKIYHKRNKLGLKNSMLKSALGVKDFYYKEWIDDCYVDYELLKKLLNRRYIDFWDNSVERCHESWLKHYKWRLHGNKSCIINETIDAPEIYFGCRFLHEYEDTDKNYEKTYWIENELEDYRCFHFEDDELNKKTMTADELYDHFKKSYNIDTPYNPHP